MQFEYKQKYLSTFIDRFIPSFWKQQYPNMWVFVKYFLQFLEEKNHSYDLINNIPNLVDIDYIASIQDEDLKEKLINSIYEQYLGSENARYLSSLLDEVLYIKYQKTINSQKGTKANLLFFFLIILNGYFSIENITAENKRHDMTYSHNAEVSYNRAKDLIEPFKYLLKSEFTYEHYKSILDTLNPAGVLPIPIFERQHGVYYFDNLKTEWNEPHMVFSDKTIPELIDFTNNYYYFFVYGEDYATTSQSGEHYFKTGLKAISKIFTGNILNETNDNEDFYLQNGKKYKDVDILDVVSEEYLIKLDTSFGTNLLIVDDSDKEEIRYIRIVQSNVELDSEYYTYRNDSVLPSIDDLESSSGFDWNDFNTICYDNSIYSKPLETGGYDLMAINFNNKKDINDNVFRYFVTKDTNRINLSVLIYKNQ